MNLKDVKDFSSFSKFVKEKINKRAWHDWMRPGSVDIELGKMLVAFAKSEFSKENLKCWAHCEVYAGRRTWLVSSVPGSNRHAKLCYIYSIFGPNGGKAVNASKQQWESVVKLIETPKPNPPSSALDVISKSCAVNITDTLSRFGFDDAMVQYVAHNDNILKRLFGGGALKDYSFKNKK
jgi:hypothetical protein